MKPADFIAAIAPAARASMGKSHIPASLVIAQGALESSWGRSALAVDALNLFGVKADPSWKGDTIQMPTREFTNGRWVTVAAKWRKYPDWLACIDDHAAFLLYNQRYHPAFEHCDDAEAFTRAIAKAGYATDPTYADKIISIIRGHGLMKFDQPQQGA
jgi:flagellar protein FlgJ